MRLNSKKQRRENKVEKRFFKPEPHQNFMAGPSYDIKNPLLQLACVSASSFFGEPMYYKGLYSESTKKKVICDSDIVQYKYLKTLLNPVGTVDLRHLSPKDAMIQVIREALDYNAEATLEWASILRNEELIRITPQVIMVEAANHPKVKGSGLVRKYAKNIIKRGDEPATQLAYQLEQFGKPIPNSLKRSWADFLKSADAYTLAKYKMENRVVKTVDVGNLAYKNGLYGYDSPIGQLMRGELKLSGENQTWESIRSAGGSWQDAIKVMGHMALLRNLRNLVKDGVDKNLYIPKLLSSAKKGMQLPFRYLTAHVELSKIGAPAYILDAIEECLELSVGNLPKLPGRSLILADNSGSTRGTPISEMSSMTVAQIGNLMAVLTGKVSEEGMAGAFGDRIAYMDVRKKVPVLDQALTLNKIGKAVGQHTENGIWLALDEAIKTKTHWDNIFVYSDQQAGHGGLYGINSSKYSNYIWPAIPSGRYIDVPKLVNTYREKVNPKVNVFLVQIAGYEDTLFPENYYRTFILGGWSGSIIKFASRVIRSFDENEKQQ